MCWTCHRTLPQQFKGMSSYNKSVIQRRTNPEQCYYAVSVYPELVRSPEDFKYMDEKYDHASMCQRIFLLTM